MQTVCLLDALIVLPEGESRVTPLRIRGGRVLSLDQPPRRGEVRIALAGKVVFPGLINAHDHLELNHYPRTKFLPDGAYYPNAHAWGEAFLPRLEEEPFRSLRRVPLAAQCAIGARKNLHCGVTTVAHHNPLHCPLRSRHFRPRVVRRYGWAHSLHFTPPDEIRRRFRATPRSAPFILHLAEGTDAAAAGELSRLDALGALAVNTILVHGVGLGAEDRARALETGAGLVWCPSSNFYLLGQTAQVNAFSTAGRLALGTDSLLTADGDLFDELRSAHATGQIGLEALFRAVTIDAARLLCLEHVGALWPGCHADFFVAPRWLDDPLTLLLALRPENVEAVYIGGQRVLLARTGPLDVLSDTQPPHLRR